MKKTLEAILNTVSDALIYNQSETGNRASFLVLYGQLRDLVNTKDPEPSRTPDVKVRIPARVIGVPNPERTRRIQEYERNDPGGLIPYDLLNMPTTIQVMAPEENVYIINGKVTTSKIFAIKALRQRENWGLKECKDYIDALAPQDAISRDVTF